MFMAAVISCSSLKEHTVEQMRKRLPVSENEVVLGPKWQVFSPGYGLKDWWPDNRYICIEKLEKMPPAVKTERPS